MPARPRWYVVHAQPHQERRAQAHLERQNFGTFLPEASVTLRHSRRFRNEQRPLFPGYLFVRLTIPGDSWRTINATRGVLRLVAAGDHPVPLPDGFVEELATADQPCDPAPDLRVGDAVRLRKGPFTGLKGRLLALRPGGRAQVMLSMLGANTPVRLQADTLTAAA